MRSELVQPALAGLVDMHTHAIDPSLVYQGDGFPFVRRTGETTATIMLRGRPYREIDERCWSIDARLRDMDEEGVAMQVVSAIPATMCYDQVADPAIAFARAQNDFLAGMVAQAPGRFAALGVVPLQDPPAAIVELRRCREDLGLIGVEIGARVGDGELGDPALREFFLAARDCQAVVFIHPVDQMLDPRAARLGLGFGAGMPAETGTAAAALLLSGLLDEVPGLSLLLAHGGGTLPLLIPRLDRSEQMNRMAPGGESVAIRSRRLWCDTLTYDPESLLLAMSRFGADHVVLGTDYPFEARESPAGHGLEEARHLLSSSEMDGVARQNARRLLDSANETAGVKSSSDLDVKG